MRLTKPQGYKTFSMLNSAEHKLLPVSKQQILLSIVVFLLSWEKYEIFYAYEYENANKSF